MKKISALLLTILLTASACQILPQDEPAPAEPAAPETSVPIETKPDEITLSMGFIPNIQFTPVYIAQYNQYFPRQNLKVDLDYGMAPDLIQLVGAGTKQFALTDGEQVIMAREQGLPVVAIMAWYQEVPAAIVSLSEQEIQNPQDLIGKKIGIPGLYGSSYTALLAFLADQQIAPEEVEIVAIGYTQIEALTSGIVDAAVVFSNNEPLQMQALDYEINTIQLNQYTNLAGASLVTNQETITNQSELVQRLVTALRQGMTYVEAEPDTAFAIAIAQIPDLQTDLHPVQKEILLASLELWKNAHYPDQFGLLLPAIWEQTGQTLLDMGLLEQAVDVSEAYTNQFIFR